MRWLLDVLRSFRNNHAKPQVEIASVWMDIDTVDFNLEPYDCAILLGNGRFGDTTESQLLFMNGLSRFVLHHLSNRPGNGFRNVI